MPPQGNLLDSSDQYKKKSLRGARAANTARGKEETKLSVSTHRQEKPTLCLLAAQSQCSRAWPAVCGGKS